MSDEADALAAQVKLLEEQLALARASVLDHYYALSVACINVRDKIDRLSAVRQLSAVLRASKDSTSVSIADQIDKALQA